MKGVTLANLERSRFFEEEPLSPSETKIEVDLLILGGIAIITSCAQFSNLYFEERI